MKKTEVLLSINKFKKAFETLKEGTIQANSQLEKTEVELNAIAQEAV